MNAESLMIKDDEELIELLHQPFEALAHADSLEDYKDIRETAQAIRLLAKNSGAGLRVINRATELRLRAERGAGVILHSLALRGGDRKTNGRSAWVRLNDLGITHNDSTRWQKMASVPEREFRRFLRDAERNGVEITSASLLRLADSLSSRSKTRPAPATGANDDSTSDECDLDSPQKIIAELIDRQHAVDTILAPLCNGTRPSGRLSKKHREELRDLARRSMLLLNKLQQLTQDAEEK